MTQTAPRLSTLAEQIANQLKGVTVKLDATEVNTDTKVGGSCLRNPGKGRTGKLLQVFVDGKEVYSHNSAQTYSNNAEVVKWLKESVIRQQLGWNLVQYNAWPDFKAEGATEFRAAYYAAHPQEA